MPQDELQEDRRSFVCGFNKPSPDDANKSFPLARRLASESSLMLTVVSISD